MYAQIGDGAIVIGDGQDFQHVFWPESGEFNNMTYFVTDKDALDHLQVQIHNGEPKSVALFFLMVSSKYCFGFRPAQLSAVNIFKVLFERLAKEAPGYSEGVAKELDGFLRSPPVLARIYDDRTLILARPA